MPVQGGLRTVAEEGEEKTEGTGGEGALGQSF